MSIRRTTIHISAIALLGIWVSFVVVAGGIFLGIRAVSAQTPVSAACMAESECIDTQAAKGGNCDASRCFEKRSDCPSGQGYCYAKWQPAKLSIGFGTKTPVDLGDFIVKFYDWAVGVAGVLAAVMMMVGGFYYLTAAGDPSRVKKGKEYLINSLAGLALVAGAYFVLQTINPDLVRFRLPKMPTVRRQFLVFCQKYEQCQPCGATFYVKFPRGGAVSATGGAGTADCSQTTLSSALTAEEQDKFELSSACTGKSCSKLAPACSDAANSCVPTTSPSDQPENNCKPGAGAVKDQDATSKQRVCSLQVDYDGCIQRAGTDASQRLTCNQQLSDCMRQANVIDLNEVGDQCSRAPDPAACRAIQGQLGGNDTSQVVMGPGVGTSVTSGPAGVDPSGVTGGYYCHSCKTDGEQCLQPGADETCCSHRCVSKYGGSAVNIDRSVGMGGSGSVCGSGEYGSVCGANFDCKTGVCNVSLFSGMCTTGLGGSPCKDNGECAADQGYHCVSGFCVGNGPYAKCDKDGDCRDGRCDPELKMCVPSGGFTNCEGGKSCPSGTVCSYGGVTTSAVADELVQTGSAVCTDGSPGSSCKADSDCLVPGAGASSKSRGCADGMCVSGAVGEACTDSVDNPCAKGGNNCVCAGAWGDKCFCMTGKEGSPCAAHDDCSTGFTCVAGSAAAQSAWAKAWNFVSSGVTPLGTCRK